MNRGLLRPGAIKARIAIHRIKEYTRHIACGNVQGACAQIQTSLELYMTG